MPSPTLAGPLHFVLPGDPDTATGGYRYDRRILAGLQALGWGVQLCRLHDGFPHPDEAALQHAAGALAALPDGALVVADGLAFGALPDLAHRHAGRLRWVALVHHPLALETGLAPEECERLFAGEQRALAAARRVVVTSAATARALAAYGVPQARIHVVEPGTDPAPLARNALTRTGSLSAAQAPGLTLLCVATLSARKGHAVLLEALAPLADRPWTLQCAGSLTRDPATAQSLRQAIDRLGLGGRVHLLGELDEAGLQGLYAQADVFVLPSFHEGYGMVLAEALARGLPVVSTTAGAIPDTVPAHAGVLVPPGDPAALGEALARLMDDAGWRARLAEGARAARGRLAGWPQAAARFATVLEGV
jgi:glycosyltransferase involved in cell wall biosynthesis